jgi:hypothetical protein
MASQSDLVGMMTRMEAALTVQAAAIGAINQCIDEGDSNTESRLAASEKKMADALAAMGSALQKLAATQQQAEASLQATIAKPQRPAQPRRPPRRPRQQPEQGQARRRPGSKMEASRWSRARRPWHRTLGRCAWARRPRPAEVQEVPCRAEGRRGWEHRWGNRTR